MRRPHIKSATKVMLIYISCTDTYTNDIPIMNRVFFFLNGSQLSFC